MHSHYKNFTFLLNQVLDHWKSLNILLLPANSLLDFGQCITAKAPQGSNVVELEWLYQTTGGMGVNQCDENLFKLWSPREIIQINEKINLYQSKQLHIGDIGMGISYLTVQLSTGHATLHFAENMNPTATFTTLTDFFEAYLAKNIEDIFPNNF